MWGKGVKIKRNEYFLYIVYIKITYCHIYCFSFVINKINSKCNKKKPILVFFKGEGSNHVAPLCPMTYVL